MADNLDNFDDYFDSPDDDMNQSQDETRNTAQASQPVSQPVASVASQGESDDDTIVVKSHKWRNFFLCLSGVIIVVFAVWFYFRYYNPYVVQAEKTGYILNIEKRGYVFKTYEGDMITEFAINDTTKTYQCDFSFSVDNDSIANQLISLQGSAKKVSLVYEEYLGSLPWRGNTKRFVKEVIVH